MAHITHNGMTLVREAGFKPIRRGGVLTDLRGERWRIIGGQSPHKPGSTGLVWAQPEAETDPDRTSEFEPGAIKARWMDQATLDAYAAAQPKSGRMPRPLGSNQRWMLDCMRRRGGYWSTASEWNCHGRHISLEICAGLVKRGLVREVALPNGEQRFELVGNDAPA
jgi:hypothetical protein